MSEEKPVKRGRGRPKNSNRQIVPDQKTLKVITRLRKELARIRGVEPHHLSRKEVFDWSLNRIIVKYPGATEFVTIALKDHVADDLRVIAKSKGHRSIAAYIEARLNALVLQQEQARASAGTPEDEEDT